MYGLFTFILGQCTKRQIWPLQKWHRAFYESWTIPKWIDNAMERSRETCCCLCFVWISFKNRRCLLGGGFTKVVTVSILCMNASTEESDVSGTLTFAGMLAALEVADIQWQKPDLVIGWLEACPVYCELNSAIWWLLVSTSYGYAYQAQNWSGVNEGSRIISLVSTLIWHPQLTNPLWGILLNEAET